MVGFIRLLYKHYDGLTIYHIQNFRPPKISASYRKIQFSEFFKRAETVFLSRLCSKVRNANAFELIDTNHSVERRPLIFLGKKKLSSASFCQNNGGNFCIFWSRFDTLQWPLHFSNFTLSFYMRICMIHLFIA